MTNVVDRSVLVWRQDIARSAAGSKKRDQSWLDSCSIKMIGSVGETPCAAASLKRTRPVALACAGVRRMLGLAYFPVWAWFEHRLAAEFVAMLDPAGGTVDHYFSFKDYPELTHDWENYAFVSGLLNSSMETAPCGR